MLNNKHGGALKEVGVSATR